MPDYSKLLVQQLYLLRYFPAYMAEYYLLYKQLLKYRFLQSPLNVFSLGAGCGVDYWGLAYAAQDVNDNYLQGLRYTGLDAIEWEYEDNLKRKECRIIKKSIQEWDKLDENKYNIIMFPKSIGEFDNVTFTHVKDIFRATNFTQDRICCICSLRDTRANNDATRFNELASIICTQHGYVCIDDSNKYTFWEKPAGIRTLCSSFIYPDDIKDKLNAIYTECPTYKRNGKTCHNDCSGRHMNSFPVLNSKYMKWQILRFERSDS